MLIVKIHILAGTLQINIELFDYFQIATVTWHFGESAVLF